MPEPAYTIIPEALVRRIRVLFPDAVVTEAPIGEGEIVIRGVPKGFLSLVTYEMLGQALERHGFEFTVWDGTNRDGMFGGNYVTVIGHKHPCSSGEVAQQEWPDPRVQLIYDFMRIGVQEEINVLGPQEKGYQMNIKDMSVGQIVHMNDPYYFNPGNEAVIIKIVEDGRIGGSAQYSYRKHYDEPSLTNWAWSNKNGEIKYLSPSHTLIPEVAKLKTLDALIFFIRSEPAALFSAFTPLERDLILEALDAETKKLESAVT